MEYCELGNHQPFIEGLAHPVVFQFQPSKDQSATPGTIHGYIRASDDPELNYRVAKLQLEALFGKGSDNSTSNTKSTIWRFGQAQVTAMIFPPELNQWMTNDRHVKIPGSATECSITIETAYCPPLSEAEQLAVGSYQEISDLKYPLQTGIAQPITDTLRRASTEVSVPSAGFGMDAQKQYLIQFLESDWLHILPTDWVLNVRYTQLNPAKGGGEILVDVRYQPAGRSDVQSASLYLIAEPYAEAKHRELALNLSAQLGVGFEEYIGSDC